MLSEIARVAISHLNKSGFEAFVKYLIEHDSNFYSARTLTEIDERIIECPPERFYQSADAFLLNYHFFGLYEKFSIDNIDFGELERLIFSYLQNRRYSLWQPVEGTTIYSIHNYDSKAIGVSDDELLNYYELMLKKKVPDYVKFGIGNINTFLSRAETENEKINESISDFFKGLNDGLSIAVSEDKISASYFMGGDEFSGITPYSRFITNPVIKLVSLSKVLEEFNELLNSDTRELELEEFLRMHYKLIFGENYDCVTTQLWLKFPEIDLGNLDRRLDIFMRNSVTSDWELFELKRPSVKLTKTVRDVPMFTSEVNNAIAQVRNYKHLLLQDSVRKQFEKDGISYFQPEIHLVIGKRPEITQNQWRRIISDESSLKILTYDNLYKSAENRLRSLAGIL